MKDFRSHGAGQFSPSDFRSIGENVIFEPGVLVFHPDRITLGRNVYVGHYAILKAYHVNEMVIGNDVWIGQQCYFHSGGGLRIGDGVGIGPGVRILTTRHEELGRSVPIMEGPAEGSPVVLEEHCDLGIGSIILPGIRVGRGAQVGAGAVVTRDVPPFAIVAGSPARILRYRPE